MSSTAWLASYPKSGNTWVRAWLDALQRGQEPDLNRVAGTNSNDGMDSSLGLSIGDLTPEHTAAMMRLSWATALPKDAPCVLRKTHHAWVPGPDDFPIHWQPAGARAVYMIRDPRAVVVSWAHHAGISIDESVAFMATDVRPPIWDQTKGRDVLTSWSNHVRSWTSQRDIPMIVVAYESMASQPAVELARIAEFLGFKRSREQIDAAVEACSFVTLATREIFEGFTEAIGDRAFFRRGEVDSWREELSPELAARISKDHGEVMEEFGYER